MTTRCRCLLIEVLLHRTGAKPIILAVLRDMVRPGTAHSLATIGEVFNRLNQVLSAILLITVFLTTLLQSYYVFELDV